MSKDNKDRSEDFDIGRSEIFNSDYYFDDIIEELSESGLYSEDDVKSGPDIKDKPGDSEQIVTKMDGMKQDINLRIQKIEQKVLNINEMLFNTKNELLQTIQKMQSNLLLIKFETEEGLHKITDLFKEKISNDNVKEKAFEELYAQLDSYKRGFIDSAMKPFIHDLLLFYDRLESDIEHSGNSEQECACLVSFKDELLEILYRNDINPMEKSSAGDKFNPEISNAVDKTGTDDPEMANTVSKVIKTGFKKGGQIIRPEMVQIYKYDPKD